MYYKSNPGNYTRCEKCKHIDKEKEECKITNDKWLVSDNAGTCHQFEGVESMKVKPINNIRGSHRLVASCDKEYDVIREEGDRFVIINNQKEEKAYYKSWFEVIEDEKKDENLEKNMSRIDLVMKSKKFFEESYKLDIFESRCPSEFELNEYNGVHCAGDNDNGCCTRCWNEPATKTEIERLLHRNKIEKLEENPHEKLTKEFTSKINTDEEDYFNVVTKEMKDLYELKNKNYGNSFSLSYDEYGLTMVCIRLEDKLRRLKSLNKQGKEANVDDESIRDTLIDLANYSVMAIMELDKGGSND